MLITWCRFFNNSARDMSVSSTLEFNPANAFHNYQIRFTYSKEDISVSFIQTVITFSLLKVVQIFNEAAPYFSMHTFSKLSTIAETLDDVKLQ